MSKEAMKYLKPGAIVPVDVQTIALLVNALREALAEQKSGIKQVIELYDSPDQPTPATPLREQEPVFWYKPCPNGIYNGPIHNAQIGDVLRGSEEWIPLYTSPPARKPLTDEEIDQGLLRSDYAFKTAEAWRAGVVFAMTKLKGKNT